MKRLLTLLYYYLSSDSCCHYTGWFYSKLLLLQIKMCNLRNRNEIVDPRIAILKRSLIILCGSFPVLSKIFTGIFDI